MWGPRHNANVHSRCCPQGEDDQVHCRQQQLDSAETPPLQTAPNSFSSVLLSPSFLHVFSHLNARKRPHSSPSSTALALDPGLGCVPGVMSLSAGNL